MHFGTKPAVQVLAAVILMVALSFPGSASAQIMIDRVIMYMSAGSPPVRNVLVKNTGKATMLVGVTAVRVTNPGAGKEELADAEEILVSPKQFSVGPEAERTVRVLLKHQPTDKEEVYRISFSPQEREDTDEMKVETKGKAINIRVLTGMGMLLFVDPKEPRLDITSKRDGDKVEFINQGNVHAMLQSVEVCLADGSGCSAVKGKRLYPGGTFEVDAPPGRMVRLLKSTSTTRIPVVVPPIS